MSTAEASAWTGGGAGRDPVSSLLDEKLRQRLRDTIGAASRVLGGPEAAPPVPAELPRLIVRLTAALEDGGVDLSEERAFQEAQLERVRGGFQRRSEALGRVPAAVKRLREITLPSAMLEEAPRLLCETSDFDRVLLSMVEDGRMVPTAAHFRGDSEAAARTVEELLSEPIRLEHPLVEIDVLRRRRATIVPAAAIQPRVHPHLAAVMRWENYVAAPVFAGSQVVAVLHADVRKGGLDLVHRDVLWRFAVGLGQAYESASLRRTLRHEREQMRRFLDRLDARLGELSDSTIQLVPMVPPGDLSEQDHGFAEGRDGTALLQGVLTRREMDVLNLVAQGLTNRAIADRLVIAEGTVKFHVHRILGKLHVSNRAEAVSRYLGLQRRA